MYTVPSVPALIALIERPLSRSRVGSRSPSPLGSIAQMLPEQSSEKR